MTKHEEVLRFIDRFTLNGKRQEVIECFSNGCCFWFAEILWQRFYWQDDVIFIGFIYDPIINHFACKINDKIYDITGDITDNSEYHWELWDQYRHQDELHTAHISRDCIYFGGQEDYE